MDRRLAAVVVVGLCALARPARGAEVALPCSWPIETTGEGATNVAYPDTDATYWTIPYDSGRWPEMRITGTFPQARFMSFTVYDATGSTPTALVDDEIAPDPGSVNPFQTAVVGDAAARFTIVIRGPEGAAGINTLLLPTSVGQVIWRVYVPDAGLDRAGGVPLPLVTLVGADGEPHHLAPCKPVTSSSRTTGVR